METQNLKQLRAILEQLQHEDRDRLSDIQLGLIAQAQEILTQADTQAKNKKLDWPTMVNLGLQAAKLIVDMLMSGGS